jgi:hypothetical protein
VTDLERFAAMLLAEWQAQSGRTDAALSVGGLLDRTFPYRSARRALQLESSEDYEFCVLRLVAEEAGLVTTTPAEAGEMARATLAEKIPDLDQLQLLRSATISFSDDAVSRLDGVRPLPQQPVVEDDDEATEPPEGVEVVDRAGERASGVIPIRRHEDPPASPKATPEDPPAAFLTGVAFTPPEGCCWQCNTPFPNGRTINFCVECGADQRAPQCVACGTVVERQWKHCPECGTGLESS